MWTEEVTSWPMVVSSKQTFAFEQYVLEPASGRTCRLAANGAFKLRRPWWPLTAGDHLLVHPHKCVSCWIWDIAANDSNKLSPVVFTNLKTRKVIRVAEVQVIARIEVLWPTS